MLFSYTETELCRKEYDILTTKDLGKTAFWIQEPQMLQHA